MEGLWLNEGPAAGRAPPEKPPPPARPPPPPPPKPRAKPSVAISHATIAMLASRTVDFFIKSPIKSWVLCWKCQILIGHPQFLPPRGFSVALAGCPAVLRENFTLSMFGKNCPSSFRPIDCQV